MIEYLIIIYNENIDHWIKYDFSSNTFYYSTYGSSGPYTQIGNGQYLKIWEMQETYPNIPSTNNFPDFWENCLVTFPNPDNYVQLVWGPYPNDPPLIGTISGFRIYRSYSQPNNFNIINEVNSSAFFYVDDEVDLSTLAGDVYYKVTCLAEDAEQDGIIESSPTNIIQVTSNQSFGKIKDRDEDVSKSFNLEQNFPNPFNPATTIKYILTQKSYVTLKVYDVLGNEVVTLVNEEKQSGTYEIEFDPAEQPSGIYFYQFRAGAFIQTKKMIYLK